MRPPDRGGAASGRWAARFRALRGDGMARGGRRGGRAAAARFGSSTASTRQVDPQDLVDRLGQQFAAAGQESCRRHVLVGEGQHEGVAVQPDQGDALGQQHPGVAPPFLTMFRMSGFHPANGVEVRALAGCPRNQSWWEPPWWEPPSVGPLRGGTPWWETGRGGRRRGGRRGGGEPPARPELPRWAPGRPGATAAGRSAGTGGSHGGGAACGEASAGPRPPGPGATAGAGGATAGAGGATAGAGVAAGGPPAIRRSSRSNRATPGRGPRRGRTAGPAPQAAAPEHRSAPTAGGARWRRAVRSTRRDQVDTRDSSADPNAVACERIRSAIASAGASIRSAAEASGTAARIARSRSRSSRSSTNRRGSWPDSTTRSTRRKTAAPSCAPKATITSSSRDARRCGRAGRSHASGSSPSALDPAISWSSAGPGIPNQARHRPARPAATRRVRRPPSPVRTATPGVVAQYAGRDQPERVVVGPEPDRRQNLFRLGRREDELQVLRRLLQHHLEQRVESPRW